MSGYYTSRLLSNIYGRSRRRHQYDSGSYSGYHSEAYGGSYSENDHPDERVYDICHRNCNLTPREDRSGKKYYVCDHGNIVYSGQLVEENGRYYIQEVCHCRCSICSRTLN